MPTAQQLYTSAPAGGGSNSFLIPAPDLRPESVKSYEAGVRIQDPSAFLSVTGFRADYTDFIQNFVSGTKHHNPGLLRLHLSEPFEGQHLGRGVGGRIPLPDQLDRLCDRSRSSTEHRSPPPNAQETAFDGDHAVFRHIRRSLLRSGNRVSTRQIAEHMGQRSARAVEPDALPPGRLRRIRRDLQLVAALGAGSHAPRLGPELHRCTLFPLAERRDDLLRSFQQPLWRSPIRSNCKPRPDERSRSERHISSETSTTSVPAH